MKTLFKDRTFVTLLLTLLSIFLWMLVPLNPKELVKFKDTLLWLNKVYGKEKYDIILIGDSRTYKGIDPDVLREHMPMYKIYNFGFSSGRINRQLLSEVYKRLDPKGKKVLVFPCTPINLMAVKNEHWLDLHRQLESLSKWPKDFYSWRLKLDSIQGRKTKIKNCLNPEFYWEKPHPNSGFVAVWQKEDTNQSTFASYMSQFQKRSFLKSDLDEFVHNLKWCKQNKIEVIAFRMMACPGMDQLEDTYSGANFDEIERVVKERGFVWLQRPLHLPLHSYDASHLDYKSAEIFSHWLGEQVAAIIK